MASNRTNLIKLLARLNLASVRRTDVPLYEVIAELIKQVIELSNQSSGGSSTTNITQIISSNAPPGMQGEDGEDGSIGPQGIPGIQGPIGPAGAAGPITLGPMGLDGNDGDDGLPIPGQQGIQGPTGATGATGPAFPVLYETREEISEETFLQVINNTIGSSGWSLIATQTVAGAAQYDFTNLSSYSEILVICRNITRSVSGITALRVSTDNGSTFLSASGDYVDLSAAGVDTNLTLIAFHTTNATAARSGWVTIQAFNKASVKPAVSTDVNNYLVTTTTALNAIRVYSGAAGGNLNAGTIYVLGR